MHVEDCNGLKIQITSKHIAYTLRGRLEMATKSNQDVAKT